MGDVSRTTQNLKVVKILPEKNLVLVKGSVPGHKGSLITLRIAKSLTTLAKQLSMKLKLFKPDGSSSSEKEISGFPVLDDGKGVDALRQVIIAVHANQRQGNASTKLRSEVAGSGKKIHRQKVGVGQVGDKRAIQRRGGGVIFGPRPRSYNQKVNRKVKHLALERALCDQAASENISLIEAWEVEEPKTKLFNQLLNTIAPQNKKGVVGGR